MKRPLIAITMGDAAGVGPEIIVKVLSQRKIYRICRPFVIGDGAVIKQTMVLLRVPSQVNPINRADEATGKFGAIDLLDLHNLEPEEVITGKICPACGKAAMEYIARAAELALRGEVAAVVTAPINKEATIQAGYGDIGHLEFLARLTGTTEYATMLVARELRVVHLSTHYSLKDACERVTEERILDKLRLTHSSFRNWGTEYPRIGVAALNPHGGEGGLFGREEISQIIPAVKAAQDLGIDARGPFPADSIFTRAIGGEFDAVLAMYHDQGHIPVKVHDFARSISVALGLPFIRTSVDHGTAFDIAGKGVASCVSLQEAIEMAVSLVQKKLLAPVITTRRQTT